MSNEKELAEKLKAAEARADAAENQALEAMSERDAAKKAADDAEVRAFDAEESKAGLQAQLAKAGKKDADKPKEVGMRNIVHPEHGTAHCDAEQLPAMLKEGWKLDRK